jgi:chemotaxis protein MotB
LVRWLVVLIACGCAASAPEQKRASTPASKPSVSPEVMRRLDQDVERVKELADLDRANEEKTRKLAEQEKTIADLQARLDGAVKSEPKAARGAEVTRDAVGRIKMQLQGELLFAPGSARITRQGREALTKIADELKSPNVQRILVEGHTDSLPADGKKYEDNWQLSAERARRVVAFLASVGVTRRMVASGYGESEPVATGDDEEARRKNRRVELFIESSSNP